MSIARELLKRVLASSHLVNGLEKEIQELLAQPEQEPVAWMYEWYENDLESTQAYCGSEKPFEGESTQPFNIRPLYTAPPKQEPLSDEEIILAYRGLVKKAIGRFQKTKPAHGIGGGE